MALRVGFVANRDESFQRDVIGEINRRKGGGVSAEYCSIPEIVVGGSTPYRVIVDRLSPIVGYFRHYLKVAALSDCYVINNPFRDVSERFFCNAIVEAYDDIPLPKALALPSKTWNDPSLGRNVHIETSDLGNLVYPLDWEGIVAHIGFPAVLKSATKIGRQPVYKVGNFPELMQIYNRSDHQVMMLQEFIPPEVTLRCFVLGKAHVLCLRYDAAKECYSDDFSTIDATLVERAKENALKINLALDHDMNCTEFAVHGGVPYAIDLVDLFLDISPERLPREAYRWITTKLADVVIGYARSDVRNQGIHLPISPLDTAASGPV